MKPLEEWEGKDLSRICLNGRAIMFKPCLDLELKFYRTQAWHTTRNHPKFEGVTINTNPH